MRNILFIILTLISCSASVYTFLYIAGKTGLGLMFLGGLLSGIFLMNLLLNVKNDRLNSYKRELEKEAVVSSENSSRVKVLESKIEVLEKALENALNKNV